MSSPEWTQRLATLEKDGWALESGEERHALYGEKFWIPTRAEREDLRPGQAVRLLFQLEAVDDDGKVEVGVERMWAIVLEKAGEIYCAVLDNQPAGVEPGYLDEGTEFLFRAEHVIDIGDPPENYVLEKYGHRLPPGRAG